MKVCTKVSYNILRSVKFLTLQFFGETDSFMPYKKFRTIYPSLPTVRSLNKNNNGSLLPIEEVRTYPSLMGFEVGRRFGSWHR